MSNGSSFDQLGLRPELIRAVTEAGYTTPTPIQAQAIPPILNGLDVMGGAQTGTGKTAVFALPILQKLLPAANASPSPARHPVRALILTPTRELAIQVEEAIRSYGKYTGLRSTVVFGGVDIRAQLPIVRGGVEILVATPGRLLDHIEQKSINLGQVEIFVLDEADRMLDMGFIPDIKRIMSLLPATAKRQNLRRVSTSFRRTRNGGFWPTSFNPAICGKCFASCAPSTARRAWRASWKRTGSRQPRFTATRARWLAWKHSTTSKARRFR